MELPQAFLARMRALLGAEYDAWLASFSAQRALGLRANIGKIAPDALAQLLDMELSPVPWCAGGFYYPPAARPGKSPFHDAGLFYMQEPSAMLPAALLAPKPGMRVLDLCAAPGGKSTQLADQLGGEGFLLSNEPYPARARVLAQNIERMGIRNAAVVCAMPDQLSARFPEYFDRVMVDAPCSGEGMFRKDDATRGEWSEAAVAHCAARQWDILRHAAAMLRPGGRLVYSTCTFAPEEDERIAARAVSELGLRILPAVLPDVSPGRPDWADGSEALRGACRIWPHKARGEGHFAVLFEKPGSAPCEWEQSDGAPAPDEFLTFWDDTFLAPPPENLFLHRDQLYAVSLAPQMLSGLRVVCPGLPLGTCRKGRFEPAHALAMASRAGDARRVAPLSRAEAMRYLHGETIAVETAPGWTLATLDSYPLGWGKISGGILKNHYPKGLRRMGNEE